MKIVIDYTPDALCQCIRAEWIVADDFTRSIQGKKTYAFLWNDLALKLTGMSGLVLWVTDSINGEIMRNDTRLLADIAKERARMCTKAIQEAAA